MIQNLPSEILNLYKERRKADIIACAQAIESNDFAFLEKIGHQVKGNASSYGFDNLTPLAQTLEDAAIHKDKVRLKRILSEFALMVENL